MYADLVKKGLWLTSAKVIIKEFMKNVMFTYFHSQYGTLLWMSEKPYDIPYE